MADLTLWTGQLCDQALDAQILQMRDREQYRTVSRTRSCPAGGEVTIEGTLNRHRHGNGDAIGGSGTGRVSECDFDRSDGAVVASGFAHWNTHQFRVGAESSGDQKTQWRGETTFRFRDGSTRICEFDVAITRNPERQQQTMEGELCGQQIRRSERWNPD
jgi:hypothetical protein